MKTTVTGTVVRAGLKEGQNFGYGARYATTFPLLIDLALELADGRKAYVSTKVAEAGGRGADAYVDLATTTRTATKPFVAKTGRNTLDVLVKAGDTVTVAGTVTTKTSKFGNEYLAVNRASLV